MITVAVPKTSTGALRVLIVEDESVVALDLEERLVRLGYAVSAVVNNGADALRYAGLNKIDLVLMDIHIRGAMDGIETAEVIRQTVKVPVIFLTAHADEATLQRAGLAEPFGYVLKPFDERELRATIEMAQYRHRAEERLRTMERWLATTLGSIGDGVIATDTDGRISFINAIAEAISGWTRGEALGRQLQEVFHILTSEGHLETIELFERTMAEGVTITLGENRCLRTRDGRLVPVDDSLAPIRDDQGSVTGCVIIFRDNTARLAAAKERRQLEVKMQEAQRLESLGILASGIAHDFNNLLVAVICNASLGRTMVASDSPILPCLNAIEEASERAALLCRQMLSYAGKSVVRLEDLELSEFTRDTAQLLQVAIDKNTTLIFDLANKLPPLRADRSQLQQVLMNLVMNGSEALAGGTGQLILCTRLFQASRDFLSVCRVGAGLAEGEYLLLQVSDTGHGMTPEVLERIFDPFFTTKFTGRGLGLAAVSGIIRTHGGALNVISKPGTGTTFQVLFPPVEMSVLPTPPVGPDLAWRGYGRALLVDDEPSIRLAGSAVLKHLGFEVDTAQNGLQGVEMATAEGSDYRVILLDLTMPKMDGLTALRAIRQKFPDLPILLMSGYSDRQTARFFEAEGPVGFVQKPFSLGNLVTTLRNLVPK